MADDAATVAQAAAFVRSLEGISEASLAKGTSCKFKLEHFYKNLASEYAEREAR
jgi:hypothetical protein